MTPVLLAAGLFRDSEALVAGLNRLAADVKE
jgi:hypothetical protein